MNYDLSFNMLFHIRLGILELDRDKSVVERVAVRAIIMMQDQILLIQTNKGDYKLPGGGVKDQESHIDALSREIREETGYHVLQVKDKIGEVIEQKVDDFDNASYFRMISHYYIVKVSEVVFEQNLDEYEKEQEFVAKFVNIQEAIHQNESLLRNSLEQNLWLYRETTILKELIRVRELF